MTPSLRGAKRRSNPERRRRTGLLRFARNDDSAQLIVQVTPSWVESLNQGQLFLSRSTFDLLFARDGVHHCRMHLVPDKYFASIPGRETVQRSSAVQPNPLRQI